MRRAPVLLTVLVGLAFSSSSLALVKMGALDVLLGDDVELVEGFAYVVRSGIYRTSPGACG